MAFTKEQNAALKSNIANSTGQFYPSLITITGTEGITGGGNLTYPRVLTLDLNSLPLESSPDSSNDYLVIWDSSAGQHKKIEVGNAGGGSSGGSSGVTYFQDTEPASGSDGETWYSELTGRFSVYADSQWQPQLLDGQNF